MENGTKPNKRELSVEIEGNEKKEKKTNSRKVALAKYPPFCAYCGFGIAVILDAAHIDQNSSNNDPANLVLLCPTCHRMLDLDLISNETIIEMRDRSKIPNQRKRIKDAPEKAWATNRVNKLKAKHQAAGRKAAVKRQQNKLKDSQ
jgi:hypothetical protein